MKRKSERGAALILAIVLMAIFGLLGAAYWQHLHFTLAHARNFAKSQAAHALAESGVERALAEFRAGNLAFSGDGPEALGEGIYTVQVTVEPDGARLVAATGALGNPKEFLHPCTIHARVHLSTGGVVAAVDYLPEVR